MRVRVTLYSPSMISGAEMEGRGRNYISWQAICMMRQQQREASRYLFEFISLLILYMINIKVAGLVDSTSYYEDPC
jgi:hypothetical protein